MTANGRAGWTRVALGDVVDVVTDYWDRNPDVPERFVAGEHIDEGELRVRRWGMTSDELVPPTFNRRFHARDVLFHSRNLKKLACPDFDGITGEKLFVLRSKDSTRLLPELLPFLLQTDIFNEYVNRMWAGSTNKFLNKAPLVKYEFALPPPDEQRRVAKLLVAAREVVSMQQAADKALALLPNALMSDFLRREFLSDKPLQFRQQQHRAPLAKAGDVLRARQGLQIVQAERSKSPGPGLRPYLTAQYLLHGGVVEYVPPSSDRVICREQDVILLRTGMTNGETFTGVSGVFQYPFTAYAAA